MEVLRPHTTDDTDTIEHKLFFSLSKPVPLSNVQANGNNEQPIITSASYSVPIGSLDRSDMLHLTPPSIFNSKDYSSSLDLGSSTKNENSGQKLFISLLTYCFSNSRKLYLVLSCYVSLILSCETNTLE